MKELRFDTGGGGTNISVGLARLGLKAAYLGCLGRDDNAETILRMLKKEKVDTSLVTRADKMSGYSVILDAKGHDRTILAHKGANNELEFRKINKTKLKQTKWIYLGSFMAKSFIASEKVAEFAGKNKINVIFNPSSYLCKGGVHHLWKILSNTTVLILNLEEAQLLMGRLNINDLLKALMKTGPKIVIITNGSKGAYAYDGEYTYFVKPHGVKILETTGAGDSFCTGFLAGYIKKKDIEFALELAQTEAEGVITHYGAKNLLLTWKQANDMIMKKPVKVVKKRI